MDGQRARPQRGPMTSKILLNHPILDEKSYVFPARVSCPSHRHLFAAGPDWQANLSARCQIVGAYSLVVITFIVKVENISIRKE